MLILQVAHLEPVLTSKSFFCADMSLSVASVARLGFRTPALDFVSVGISLLLKSYA